MGERGGKSKKEAAGCTIRCPTCGEPMEMLGMGAGFIEVFARLVHKCDENMFTHVSVYWISSYTDDGKPYRETIYEICISEDECRLTPVCMKIYGGMFSNIEYDEYGSMIIKEYPCKCPLMGIPITKGGRLQSNT